jgi:HSP20 family protein
MRDNAVTPLSRRSSALSSEGRYDPFSAFRQQMDRLFDDFFAPAQGALGAGFAPPLDFSETDRDVRVRAELPGVEEKDIDVSIDGQMLTIKGEKRSERDESDEKHRLIERSYGAFSRAVRLPFEPKDSDIKAKFDKGVLSIIVAKPAETAASVKRIPIGKA